MILSRKALEFANTPSYLEKSLDRFLFLKKVRLIHSSCEFDLFLNSGCLVVKGTCRVNFVKNRLMSDLIDYVVCLDCGMSFNVLANRVLYSEGGALVFKIVYENNVETVLATFKNWSWFNAAVVSLRDVAPEE